MLGALMSSIDVYVYDPHHQSHGPTSSIVTEQSGFKGGQNNLQLLLQTVVENVQFV